MTSSIWAGEVGDSYGKENSGPTAVLTVTDVDTVNKVITLDEASQRAVAQTGETVVDGVQFTEAEEAAGKFTYFLASLKREMGGLSAKGAARVVHRLAEFPLGDTVEIDKMGFRSRKEKLLFQLFYEINVNKNIIISEMQKQKAELEPEKDKANVGE